MLHVRFRPKAAIGAFANYRGSISKKPTFDGDKFFMSLDDFEAEGEAPSL